jgi:uncharacterized coiled-coil DUF342 family protein
MPNSGDFTKSVVTEEERKRLISEIARIKEILDSFKYGLNFENFADELFKTVDRQTLAIKKLDEHMTDIVERMNRLEKRFNEGIKVAISGTVDSDSNLGGEGSQFILDDLSTKKETIDEPILDENREAIEKEIGELTIKIARLLEKENELEEMTMNDPDGAEEYEEKASTVRDMRRGLEEKLKDMKTRLK